MNKLRRILKNEYEREGIHKINEVEVYTIFFEVISRKFKTEHVPDHQDKNRNYNLLNIKGKFYRRY